LAKSQCFSFFNLTFFEHFVTKVYLHFWNQHKILDFLYPIWPISRQNISPLRRVFFKFLDIKPQTRQKLHKIEINTSSKLIQKYLKHCKLKNHCTLVPILSQNRFSFQNTTVNIRRAGFLQNVIR
jgi:hypothetical protein